MGIWALYISIDARPLLDTVDKCVWKPHKGSICTVSGKDSEKSLSKACLSFVQNYHVPLLRVALIKCSDPTKSVNIA